MEPILDIRSLTKTYSSGLKALDHVDLQVRKGEIFALLGPNGAGKTTLIGSVCGMVRPTSGSIHAFGLDLRRHWREARQRIGLVPQELGLDMFDTVERQVRFSRGLFGRPMDETRITHILSSLQLLDKRHEQLRKLSGGMKRRVAIARALACQGDVLFLDEPFTGLDEENKRIAAEALLETKAPIIVITHDEAEAALFGGHQTIFVG